VSRVQDLQDRPLALASIEQDASIEQAVLKFLEQGISSLIVYDGERFAGLFTKNDLVRCCRDHPRGLQGLVVADYMTRHVYTAEWNTPLDEVAKQMIEGDFRHVPVLDGVRVVRVVTPIDILLHEKGRLLDECGELIRYINGVL